MAEDIRPLVAVWLAVTALAVALSVAAAGDDALPGDRDVMDWVQDRTVPGQDLSDFVRDITGTEVVLATGAAVALILWLRGYRRQAALFAGGLVALAVLQPLVKEVVDRPRPDPALVDVRAGSSSPSFPAGHVMSAGYLYGYLLYISLTMPIARVPATVLAAGSISLLLLVGVVNVWVGVHWPSDVVGAWLWALVILLPVIAADAYLSARA